MPGGDLSFVAEEQRHEERNVDDECVAQRQRDVAGCLSKAHGTHRPQWVALPRLEASAVGKLMWRSTGRQGPVGDPPRPCGKGAPSPSEGLIVVSICKSTNCRDSQATPSSSSLI